MTAYNLDKDFASYTGGRRALELGALVGVASHTITAAATLSIVGSRQVPLRGWVMEGVRVSCTDDCAFTITLAAQIVGPNTPAPVLFEKVAGDGFTGDVILSGVAFKDGDTYTISQTAGTESRWEFDVRVDA